MPRSILSSRTTGAPRLARSVLPLAVLMAALAACGGSESDAGEATEARSVPPMRTVQDATGTVEVPTDATRPVPTDGIWAANMLSLGVVPAAVPGDVKLQLSTVEELLPAGTDLESLPEVGLQYDLNLEAMAAATPDLIIASEYEAEEYGQQLREIAPTFFVADTTNGEWRERFLTVAEVFGRQDEAQAVSDDFDTLVGSLPPEVDDRTVAFVRAESLSDIRADVLQTSFAGSVAREAGIPVLDLAESVDIPADASWVDISEENVGLLAEADVIVVADLSFYDPALGSTDAVLEGSALWSSLPAVEAGDVVVVPGPVYNGGHYQAATALLEAIADTVNE